MKYLFAFLTSFLFSAASYACTCATPSVEEAFAKSDYVYVGVIETAKLSDEKEVTNYLSVVKEYKGTRETDILISNVSFSSCASPSAVGYEYVIFGTKGTTPKLESCSQTQILFNGKKELLSKLEKLAANKPIKRD